MGADSGAVEIAAGSVDGKPSTCALLSTGKVACWGDNTGGRLGTGSTEETVEQPAEVLGLSRATGLRIEGSKRCVLDSAGSVWGWGGWNVDGTSTGQPTQLVAPRSGRTEMAMGPSHACIVSSGGRGECWGNNRSGQLGTWAETNSDESVPVEVKGINVAAIAAGDDHTCVLTRTGTIVCFGDGGGGLGPTPRLIELRQP